MVKRILDITISLIGLIVLAPIFAVIAILIKLDSPVALYSSRANGSVNMGKPFISSSFGAWSQMLPKRVRPSPAKMIPGSPG